MIKVHDWTDEDICNRCFERGTHHPKDCPWTQDELRRTGTLAAFIAARLNYIVPDCNGSRQTRGMPISTISVSQHKEKFFWVRIYCGLANKDMVQARWTAEGNEGEPTPEYHDKRKRLDAWHYRTCYLDMMRMVDAKYKFRIRSQADFAELLFDDEKELFEKLDKVAKAAEASDIEYDGLAGYRSRWGAKDNEELKQKLAALYKQPSLREWLGDA